MSKKKIIILGSTGSIGCQTLDVINQDNTFEIEALTANNNVDLLLEQSEKYGVKKIGVANKELYQKYKDIKDIKIYWGEEEIEEMIRTSESKLAVMAISGAKGLKPCLAAIESKKDIALATKEVMVLAGEIINQKLKENQVNLFPVDSEHSAIWQCLRSGNENEIEKIILTCSGGPFRNFSSEELLNITPQQALNHPNWLMGKRITIDCASLMNKGLELIEAKWIFEKDTKQIEIVIHPESIVHSAVQYIDGSIIAQLGPKDMRLPIQYALNYPSRLKNNFPKINLMEIGLLNFFKPDLEKFPCLQLAINAAEAGGTLPVVLNAADEIAVDLFLKEKIKFLDIPKIIETSLNKHKNILKPSLEDIFSIDLETRKDILSSFS